MDEFAIGYALAKQLSTASAIESAYGTLELDEEMRQAVDAALRPILERRLRATKQGASHEQ